MVQAESHYGTILGQNSYGHKSLTASKRFEMTFRGAAIMILTFSAIVGVVTFSGHLSESVVLEQTELHQSTQSEADVADAILASTGEQGRMGSIPASIAALAAQAAHEKETGRLSTTVELPQIPKSIAKMAAEAKHEIQIERAIDKKRKAAAAAKKALTNKKSDVTSSTEPVSDAKSDSKKAAATKQAAATRVSAAHTLKKLASAHVAKGAPHKAAAHAKLLAKKAAHHHSAVKAAHHHSAVKAAGKRKIH